MENLTIRQIELIEDLLFTYSAYREYLERDCGKKEAKYFVFKDNVYKVLELDYNKVCRIIDCIRRKK